MKRWQQDKNAMRRQQRKAIICNLEPQALGKYRKKRLRRYKCKCERCIQLEKKTHLENFKQEEIKEYKND